MVSPFNDSKFLPVPELGPGAGANWKVGATHRLGLP
jgi:hypothetical protein